MKRKYEQIDFSIFTEEAKTGGGQGLTDEEKERILKNFYESIELQPAERGAENFSQRTEGKSAERLTEKSEGISAGEAAVRTAKSGKPLSRRNGLIAAACACLILCTAVTPMGEKVFAAAKDMFMGIGEFLGMSRQDNYATEVNKTQTKNGVTVTLCEAVGSDHEIRFSVQVEKEGKPVGGSKVGLSEVSYNGYNWHKGMKSTGYGNFGSNLPKEEQSPDMHYLGETFEDFEMPKNPSIDVKISACGEFFDFNFVLKNEAFKEATKRVPINRTILYRGMEIKLKELVITPIDQWIITEAPDFSENGIWKLSLYGTDQNGDSVHFYPGIYEGFRGNRENGDETTYQLNYNVKSYTLRAYDGGMPGKSGSEETAVSEPFTIEIPEK